MREFAESDLAFRLGWLGDPESAERAIKQVLQPLVRENLEFCSEADTRLFVEAILRGLGWDTLASDVAREGKPELGDFHLYYNKSYTGEDRKQYRKIAALIEVERFSIPRGELKRVFERQLIDYIDKLRTSEIPWIKARRLERAGKIFVYGVLTNGQLWWIYNFANWPQSVESPRVSFDLLEAEAASVHGFISVLGKEQMCSEVEKFLGD